MRRLYILKTSKSLNLLAATLRINKIHSVLIDSYTFGLKWEKYLSEKGFFIIAIDDHLKTLS